MTRRAHDGYVVLNAENQVYTEAAGDEWASDHARVYTTRRAAERAAKKLDGRLRVATYDHWEKRFCSKRWRW